ncbi:DNA-directed DNA polymerase [Batrachochytrium dendrobatidis]|nr:DNA-directed DNA polymerase [Batrachochytrium dendrobatidis]KAK5671592.1 DNA-directed DNA polymerase [Batrachochytrium dendrobatidis]
MSPAMTDSSKSQPPVEAVKIDPKQNMDQQSSTLAHYSLLASLDAQKRLESAEQLMQLLVKFQSEMDAPNAERNESASSDLNSCYATDVTYGLRRLLRGLSSSRDAARQGFSVALTELLSSLPMLEVSTVLKMLHDCTQENGNRTGQEEKELHLGRMFGYMAMCKSGMLSRKSTTLENVLEIVTGLLKCATKKSYFSQAAYQVLIAILKEIQQTDLSKSVSEAMIRLVLNNGVTNAQGLWFAIEAQHCAPSFDKWDEIMVGWKSKKIILHRKNKDLIVDILKNTTDSGPRVHSVWTTIINLLVEKNSPLSSKQLSIEEFWESVEATLFTTSHERKHIGFQVFEAILLIVDEKQIPFLLTPHFLHCLIDSLSKKNGYFYKQALHTATNLSEIASEKPFIAFPLMMRLVGKNGSLQFDTVTKTKTVENIITTLDTDQIESYIDFLVTSFTDPSSMLNDSLVGTTSSTRVESVRRWILQQMFQLVRMGRLHKEQGWISLIIEFVVVHGFFKPLEVDSKQEFGKVSDDISTLSRERLVSILGALGNISLIDSLKANEAEESVDDDSNFKKYARIPRAHLGKRLNGDTWIYYVCQLLKEMESNKQLTPLGKSSLNASAHDAIQTCYDLVETIRERKAATPEENASLLEELSSFESLVLHILLNIYYEPEEFTLLAKEIKDCYTRMHPQSEAKPIQESKKRKAANAQSTEATDEDMEASPEPIEVIVDVLIGLLVKPCTLLRSMVSDVFRGFCSRMTSKAIQLILDILSTKSGVQGASQLFETEGEEISDDQEDDTEEESDDDDSDDNEEEEEEDLNAPVDEEFRRKVVETLGKAALFTTQQSNDEEAESDDEGIDDDEMQIFDDKLAEIFRQRYDIKQTHRSVKQNVVHFKSRVMDLLDVFVKEAPTSALMIPVCKSLIAVAQSIYDNSNETGLYTRTESILSQKICKAKAIPIVPIDAAIDALKDVHEKLMGASEIKFGKLCNLLSLYLVKVIKHSSDEMKSTTTEASQHNAKRIKSENENDSSNSANASMTCASEVDQVCDIYMSTFTGMLNKDLRVQEQMLQGFIVRFSDPYAAKIALRISSMLLSTFDKPLNLQIKTFPLICALKIFSFAFKHVVQTDVWLNQDEEQGIAGGCKALTDFFKVATFALDRTKSEVKGPFFFSNDRVCELVKEILVVLKRAKLYLRPAKFVSVCLTEELATIGKDLIAEKKFKDFKRAVQVISEINRVCLNQEFTKSKKNNSKSKK